MNSKFELYSSQTESFITHYVIKLKKLFLLFPVLIICMYSQSANATIWSTKHKCFSGSVESCAKLIGENSFLNIQNINWKWHGFVINVSKDGSSTARYSDSNVSGTVPLSVESGSLQSRYSCYGSCVGTKLYSDITTKYPGGYARFYAGWGEDHWGRNYVKKVICIHSDYDYITGGKWGGYSIYHIEDYSFCQIQ